MESDIFVKILLSVLFGAILGLETETRENEKNTEKKVHVRESSRIGGFRTYTLISLMGGISGILYINKLEFVSFTLLIALVSFLLIAYLMNIRIKEAFGITTEIAIVITFILGFITTSSIIKIEIVLVVLVLMAFFLSQKRGFGQFISKIQHREVIDVFRFGLIALVILPIFPNRVFSVLDVAHLLGITDIGNTALQDFTLGNPFQIWLIVVVISGINLLGYIMSKVTGERIGLFFTSIFSGFISSTSGIISFATKSKVKNENLLLAGAAIISNAVSFIIVAGLLFLSNREFFSAALPILLGEFILGFVIGCILIFIFRSDTDHGQVEYQAFSVLPALKFVGIILILSILVQILEMGNVDPGLVIIITALSGVTGIDAPTIAIAGLLTSGVITVDMAVSAFLLTSIVNFIAKGIYAYTIGSRKYAQYLSIGLILSAFVGLLIYLM